MKKIGNYIIGASVVAVLGATAIDSVNRDAENEKTEFVSDELKEDFVDGNIIAFEQVAVNESLLKNDNEDLSRKELKNQLKKDSWKGYGTIRSLQKASRIDNLEYQNDTIDYAEQVGSMAYFRRELNTITNNVFEGKKEDKLRLVVNLAHEVEHMHQNNEIDVKADMSLWQSYKVYCYEEIAANIAELLQLRAMYKEAKSQQQRNVIINKAKEFGFGFYFDEVESGKINPLSELKKDFDLEMKFIANKTRDNWIDNKFHLYDKEHTDFVLLNVEEGVGSVRRNDENYNKIVSKIMDIGGVNFSKFWDKRDIESWTCNKSFIQTDNMIENGKDVSEAIRYIEPINNIRDNCLKIIFDDELKDFGLEQRYNLAINNYLADYVKMGFVQEKNEKINFDELKNDFEQALKDDFLLEKSERLMMYLSDNPALFRQKDDKEYKKKLREIWTVNVGYSDETVCLLDLMGKEEFDISGLAVYPGILRDKDRASFWVKAKDLLVDKLGRNDWRKREVNLGDEYRKNWMKDGKLQRSRYDLELSGRRSKVLQTSEVIDTRDDFLVKERNLRKDKISYTLGKKNLKNKLIKKTAGKKSSLRLIKEKIRDKNR